MSTLRYKVQEDSLSGHCCFNYTVVDTRSEDTVCECFVERYAVLVCEALNLLETQP